MKTLGSVAQVGAADPVVSSASPSSSVVKQMQEEDSAKEMARKPTEKETNSVVKELNDAMKLFNTTLSFSVDKETGITVIKVMDSTTKDVIRQIPPEDILKTAERIHNLLGVLFDKKQ